MPLAVLPSAVDARVTAQRSCFTIHGTEERDFEALLLDTNMVAAGYFRKYLISRERASSVLDELDEMGISFSTIYPDFQGLAKELKLRFGPKPELRHCVTSEAPGDSDSQLRQATNAKTGSQQARLIGIDGCKSGWVLASADSGSSNVCFEVVPDLRELFASAERGDYCVVIDIPIGLPEDGLRPCDLEARKAIGPRASSVFPTPCRASLTGWREYRAACDLNEEACGKRLSRQAFAILPKIREVDQLVTPEMQASR